MLKKMKKIIKPSKSVDPYQPPAIPSTDPYQPPAVKNTDPYQPPALPKN